MLLMTLKMIEVITVLQKKFLINLKLGNYVTNEVAIDYNAGLTGLLAAAVMDSGRLSQIIIFVP